MENHRIELRPVGEVVSDVDRPLDMPLTGKPGVIRIYPEFVPALYRVEDHSHLWVLSWFHEANRNLLRVAPGRLNPALAERGVFGLRSIGRPNPIGLSLVKLLKIDAPLVYASGFDAIGGTRVLDIKPYFEQDIIFSPRTPYLRPVRAEVRRDMFWKEAVNHHQEECPWLEIGVRLALIADEQLGKIQSPDLKVKVVGPACLADVIQGLTRARLSNPSRFEYRHDPGTVEVSWANAVKSMMVTLRSQPDPDGVSGLDDNQLFNIEVQTLS
jgi:tRNA (adenine37-N6)-methyltransferase